MSNFFNQKAQFLDLKTQNNILDHQYIFLHIAKKQTIWAF
jgi:hypothetical protein